MKQNILVFLIVSVVVILALSGCVTPPPEPPNGNNTTTKLAAELPKFSSCSAIVDAFNKSVKRGGYGIEKMAILPLVIPQGLTSTTKSLTAGSSPEYSSTNVQVAGVDEADIIKTDGHYIYSISNGEFHIVEAYPIESAKLLSSVDLKNVEPEEMFIDGDAVLIFGRKYLYDAEGKYKPSYYGSYGTLTVLQLWNVSDKKNPELIKTVEFEGNYLSSRKIGSDAYFVIKKYEYSLPEDPGEIIPLYREGVGNGTTSKFSQVSKCVDVSYLPPIRAENFVIVGSLSMSDFDAPVNKKVVVASGEDVYASMGNLYIAEVDYDEYWVPIAGIPFDFYRSEERTTIHKFALSDGNITYVGAMNASGHILNQFSMDEHNGYFRIATTKGEVLPYGTSTVSNNIYTFDSELKLKGKLEGLAPGEKIYSARFMGDRAYLVTFKKVDPLFVINLTDQTNPTVLGKLKIPGYSDYLHPLDENHILGLGKDTVEAKEGTFAWYQGIKMAVFDVSDVSKPKEKHKIIIGDRGTESYALSDHKAFLYDDKKDLLVIPVLLAEIDEEKYAGKMPANAYGDYVFQGAYVFNLTIDGGFGLKGKITHVEDNQSFLKSGYYYYGSDDLVKRSLFIGNVLYTFSDKKILANDLSDLKQLANITLSNETKVPYYYYD